MKTMKRITAFTIACCLCILCCACGGNQGTDPSSSEEDTTPAESTAGVPDETPSEVSSEKAMDNFVKRLEAGNYVVGKEGFLKTTVCSPDLVYFLYDDESFDDVAYITLDNETFQGVLGEDAVGDIAFASTEDAVRTARALLPNYWMTVGEGNMFNLFYNNVEKPLEFVSYEDAVKTTLIALAGYGDSALKLMHEVYMTLDAEDPATVRFTAEVDDDVVARIFYDDLDLTLEFGGAESDPRIDKWLSAPVYPEARTEWTESDLFFLNSVFLPGYGADALPFPRFASYAMTIDQGVFNASESIRYTDPHGTEKNVEEYVKTLLAEGFTAVEEKTEDGGVETVYRRVLREEYRCYVSVCPSYENGFVLEAARYYDNPRYEGLHDVNEVLLKKGYAALPENGHLTGWSGEDNAAERTESWLYFFTYDVCLEVSAHYDDADEAALYLKAYGKMLEEKGFVPDNGSDSEGEEGEEGEEAEEEEGVYGRYASPNGMHVVQYRIDEDTETLAFQFRNEKEITGAEAEKMIKDAGIPEVTLKKEIVGREVSGYHRMTREFEGRLYLSVQQSFDSAEEAKKFLDEYTAKLEEAGYYRTNPENIGTLKQNAYYNEEEDKFVSFDYFETENGADVNLDFVSNT